MSGTNVEVISIVQLSNCENDISPKSAIIDASKVKKYNPSIWEAVEEGV